MDVDPKGYYQAATNCFDAAEALRDSFLYIFRELSGCGAMAGVDEDGKAWATSYDTAAYQMVSFFAEVHSTLNAYGSALNDLGFNHAQADSALQGTPQPQRPADRGTPVFGPYSVPASAGGTGKGIIDESIGLLSEIGVPVPDGDTDKLLKAADAWDRLGTIYQNTNAKDKITIAAGLFDNMTAPDAIQAGQDLKSLESSIAQLLNSCKDIAKSCTDYRDALKELRAEIKDFLADLAEQLAIDAAITIVATAVSFGAGAITAVKSLATLKKWAGKVKDAIKLWKARKVAQLKGIADEAKTAMSAVRQKVRDLFERLRKNPEGMRSAPKVSLRTELDNAQAWKNGNLPTKGGPVNGYLVKRDPQGNITNYSYYDENGIATKRVDLTGDAHFNKTTGQTVSTPHVVEIQQYRNPTTGEIFARTDRNNVRPALPEEIP
ncbi:polymorphic toxin type 24 domain-containing protein [Nocardia yamanashiensis]|uniref:polymorphic toxin type 24 domain-containing protein n=1 Tax=Nocardia yamanashiensis TaxID=209247 RepID=UPI001E54DC50|nr:polymorphic toxin type 24 domain-containing protein [Nocardia yamanashiensis]UGT39718.1 polymorphic toxin type 24 domain-containing protein [Nocardia yamanashiensis]